MGRILPQYNPASLSWVQPGTANPIGYKGLEQRVKDDSDPSQL